MLLCASVVNYCRLSADNSAWRPYMFVRVPLVRLMYHWCVVVMLSCQSTGGMLKLTSACLLVSSNMVSEDALLIEQCWCVVVLVTLPTFVLTYIFQDVLPPLLLEHNFGDKWQRLFFIGQCLSVSQSAVSEHWRQSNNKAVDWTYLFIHPPLDPDGKGVTSFTLAVKCHYRYLYDTCE